MKFTIKKQLFLQPLQKLNSIISITNINTITHNILIQINHQDSKVISTNLEIELIKKIHCSKIEQIGSVIVSGKKILNIIKNFPNNAEILIEIQNENLKITYQNIYFVLKVYNEVSFPRFIQEKKNQKIIINQKKIRDIIHNTYFCMAKQDIRHYLNGMNITFTTNAIFAVATDSYRMAISTIKNENSYSELSIIIPYQTIIELLKILNDTEVEIKIIISIKIIQFHIQEYILSSKLIDHTFPDYQNLLVKKFDTKIIINKEILKKSLIRASILTHSKIQGVRLNISNTSCIINAHNEQDEKIQEKIPIDYCSQSANIILNIHYLLDVINIIQSEKINILLKNNNSSIYIQDVKEFYSFYIIMPLVL